MMTEQGRAPGPKGKERADILLVSRGLSPSREKAKAMIMAGQVFVGAKRIDKAGEMLGTDSDMQVKGQVLPYVSRGGLKLEKALACFPICLEGRIALDIGASTGGFTDCALQHGAAKVYAVDVGYGQLAWKLRQDPRVVVREKTNARYLSLEALGEAVDFVTLDASFISLEKLFPVLPALLRAGGEGVALVKPQFEAGRGEVGRKGVVKSPAVHREVLGRILRSLPTYGLHAYGLTWSPVKGPQGNIEYLLWFGAESHCPETHGGGGMGTGSNIDQDMVVEEAFRAL